MMRLPIKTLAVAALTAGSLVAAPAAFAAETLVPQEVTGVALSASVTGGDLPGVITSHSDRDNGTSTPFTLRADDLSGTAAGWDVTLEITSVGGFTYNGDNGGEPIAASEFSIATGTVAATDGVASIDGLSAGPGGTLDGPVKVLSANADSGVGDYTSDFHATLRVPADSMAGTYTGTLTTTITTAP